MANCEFAPSIGTNVIRGFLEHVRQYIKENPNEVHGLNVTSEDLEKRPLLKNVPCEVKENGECYNSGLPTPDCDFCPHAMETMNVATKLATEFEFTTAGEIIKNPDYGRITLCLKSNISPDAIQIVIAGNRGGELSASSQPTRRPSK